MTNTIELSNDTISVRMFSLFEGREVEEVIGYIMLLYVTLDLLVGGFAKTRIIDLGISSNQLSKRKSCLIQGSGKGVVLKRVQS